MKNKTILLISPEAWGTNFVSKHHYANYLAKDNTVYFLNPVRSSKMNPFSNVNLKLESIKDNLFQLNYQNLLPRLNKLPKFIQNWIFKKQARQIQKHINIKKFDIVWSFDPYRFWNQNNWESEKTIYHTVDFHPQAIYQDDICLTSSTVIGVTPLVINSIKTSQNQIYKIGHGADIDNFIMDETFEVPGKNKVKACYTGNFHKNIDYNLLISIAKNNNNLDFILIGPYGNNNLSTGNQIELEKLETLRNLSNVYFTGSIPSHLLMKYINKCDINLVLFKKKYETLHCSPHKMMAYFYSGNITLSNYIDEHKHTDSDIIIMLDDIKLKLKEIVKNIAKYNTIKLIEKRKKYALENSYDNKIKEISEIIYPN